jgi:hypothetical protein
MASPRSYNILTSLTQFCFPFCVFVGGEGPLCRFTVIGYSFQRRYEMNGRSQMQGGKNWILLKELNANRFFWDSHSGNLEKPLMYLYGTELRECGYGLSRKEWRQESRAFTMYNFVHTKGSLKGLSHEIFDFRFFSWNSFPHAPEYPIRANSIFFLENSRK